MPVEFLTRCLEPIETLKNALPNIKSAIQDAIGSDASIDLYIKNLTNPAERVLVEDPAAVALFDGASNYIASVIGCADPRFQFPNFPENRECYATWREAELGSAPCGEWCAMKETRSCSGDDCCLDIHKVQKSSDLSGKCEENIKFDTMRSIKSARAYEKYAQDLD